MSLFNELQQGQIIEKPKQLGQYYKLLSKKKEEEKVKTRDEIRKEKRKQMPKKEYQQWLQEEWYKRNKDKMADKYQAKKNEKELYIEEIIKEVYDPLPEPINYDKYYLEKFKNDNTNSEGKYKFGRWKSRIVYDKKYIWRPIWEKPVKIITRKGLPEIYARTQRIEEKAYEYIKPHIDKITLQDFWLAPQQIISKYPLWHTGGLMRELCDNTDIPQSHLCNVASAMLRDVYIISEAYLGRNSFIVGDVIITQTGALLPISLDNSVPRLNKDTVEEYHNMRVAWNKSTKVPAPPIYRLADAYLLRIHMNEREDYWYVVPFKNNFISKK